MKSIIILVTPFLLTGPVLAEPADNEDSPQKPIRTAPRYYENGYPLPGPAYEEGPKFIRLIQTIDNNQKIITIKT